jgi:hypothetical protein
MDNLDNILRQRKLLLWRKILETFPIEPKLQAKVVATIFPPPPLPAPVNERIQQQPPQKAAPQL